ncbi:hypothetical protein [Salinimicrobium sp. GXAS 041]|uniref:hypothetical protein n=1 Tax=Salinimicrobium sp. GXAS 041 TaxID=3400806 RepID=UPI003C734941
MKVLAFIVLGLIVFVTCNHMNIGHTLKSSEIKSSKKVMEGYEEFQLGFFRNRNYLSAMMEAKGKSSAQGKPVEGYNFKF